MEDAAAMVVMDLYFLILFFNFERSVISLLLNLLKLHLFQLPT